MRPVWINEAEAVVAPFWDPGLSPLARCETTTPATNARVRQDQWHSVIFEWDHAEEGALAVTLRCPLGVELGSADALRVRAGAPDGARLQLVAVVDGAAATVLEQAGDDTRQELTAPISGRVLDAVELRFVAARAGGGVGSLDWIALVDREAERRMLSRPTSCEPSWPGFMRSGAEVPALAPAAGLLLGGADLAALRRKAAIEPYAGMVAGLRELAESYRAIDPEQLVDGEVVVELTFCRNRLDGRPRLDLPAIVCSFVGLLDDDPELLRHAARFVLTMAHMPSWNGDGFRSRFPGGTWRWGAYIPAAASLAVTLGADWSGGVLTPYAHRMVNDTVVRRGLSLVELDYLAEAEHGWTYSCNTGPAFMAARVLGWLNAERHWPRARAYWEHAERDLHETLTQYVLPDGGIDEGVAYWCYALGGASWAMAALARRRGLTPREYLRAHAPERMQRCGDYLFAMLSTAGRAGACLPISDSSDRVAPGVVAFLASASEDARFGELLAALDTRDSLADLERSSMTAEDLVLALVTGPEQPPRSGAVAVPDFAVLPDTGMLTSVRPFGAGVVRLQLVGSVGRRSYEDDGHAHEDRGALLLEALGETLALDRGSVNYGSSSWLVVKQASSHNVVTPVLADGVVVHQAVPARARPAGTQQDGRLDASIDLADAWREHASRAARRVVSPHAGLLFVIDELELGEELPLAFNLHSPFAGREAGAQVTIAGARASLAVTPLWQAAWSATAEDPAPIGDSFDKPPAGAGTVQHHVWRTLDASRSHRLVTALEIVAVGEPHAAPDEIAAAWAREEEAAVHA